MNMFPAFVGLQINFTTSCATASLFFMLVTLGSVWAKKKKKKITGCSQDSTQSHPLPPKHIYFQPQPQNQAEELKDKSEEAMTAGFSPNAPNRALFSRVAEGRDVLLPKKKKNHFDAI